MDLDDLLRRTSRTFALAIPLLEEPTRREVGIAYLLFRIADTFEDESRWPKELRRACLLEMADVLEKRRDAKATAAAWMALPALQDPSCADLVSQTADVLDALDACGEAASAIVRKHVRRTALGMADVVESSDEHGELVITDVEGLKKYCYIVAGIVGEMLTELFVLAAPTLEPVRAKLDGDAGTFGEGLQLVNILKDAGGDVTEGRSFLPEGVPLPLLFQTARADLDRAKVYVRALHDAHAPRGTIAFTALPVMLAYAALDAVEAKGSGAKVPREDVMRIYGELDKKLDEGVFPL
ncbi:phytoene/squalene synthase family protein [soil metagenome]